VDHLIPIQWSNGQEVAWLVLLAAWWLNLGTENIATVQREMLTGALYLARAVCIRIGAIDLIPEGNRGYPTTTGSFGPGFFQTFAPYMSGRLPTTPEKGNSCSCGAATSAGIVKSGESSLHQE
jgi:hypothetical protein